MEGNILEEKKEFDHKPVPVRREEHKESNPKQAQNEIKINIKLDDLKKVIEESDEKLLLDSGEAKSSYDALKSKFNVLPEFDNLDNEFEISMLETGKFYMRNIRRRIIERTDFFAKILESYIGAEPTMTMAVESQALTEADIAEMTSIFKVLSYFEKSSLHIALLGDQKKEADFIKEVYDEWMIIKPSLIELLNKIKNSWKKELKKDPKVKYFN